MKVFKSALLTVATLALLGEIALAQEDQPPQQQPANTYASLDADSDGKVTLEEFKTNFSAPNRQGGRTPQPDRIFGRWDADGDGNLTAEEFANRPRRGNQRPQQ